MSDPSMFLTWFSAVACLGLAEPLGHSICHIRRNLLKAPIARGLSRIARFPMEFRTATVGVGSSCAIVSLHIEPWSDTQGFHFAQRESGFGAQRYARFRVVGRPATFATAHEAAGRTQSEARPRYWHRSRV